MQIPVRLVLHRLHHLRMTMPGIADADAADKIQIDLSAPVIEITSFRPDNLQTQRTW